jgi:RNA polymerase sigma factor (sigma-70 family)
MSLASPALSTPTFVKELVDGRPSAFAQLDATYRPMIISIARQCGLNHHDAEDIAQDTLMITYRRIRSLADPSALGGWIRTTAMRQSWRASSAERRQRDRSALLATLELSSEVDEQLMARETLDRAVAAIELLSARERHIIQLTVLAESPVPYAEVAAQVGCAVGSVGALRRRALGHLDRIMQHLDQPTSLVGIASHSVPDSSSIQALRVA